MKKIFSIILISCTLIACSNTLQRKKVLTVTIEPLRYFTEAIAGENYQVVSMVPKGSSPETYDPTPQQLVQLHQSQGYLRIGHIGFEQVWMNKLRSNVPNMKVFDTSEGIDFIRSEGHWHGDHFHEGGIEPHIWNSTINAAIIADNICQALCELDATNKIAYEARRDSLKQIIIQTDKEIRSVLQDANATFLIYHPALSYFARDYGLKQISIEEGGKEPSPAHLKHLIEMCKREKAKVIFVQQEFDQRNAQLIADELGIKVILINPLSYDWKQEMLNVAKAIKKH